MLMGSTEVSGTKFVCAVCDEDYRVQDQVTFLTATSDETLKKRLIISNN